MASKNQNTLMLSIIFFTISLCASAQDTDRHILDKFRWNNRLLLIFAPSIEDPVFVNADNTLKKNIDGVIDRDLTILYIFEESQSIYGDSLINQKTSKYLREKFYAATSKTTFILLGKDGGEKMRTINQFSIDRLFTRIDEMPMRRSELEERTFSFDSIKFE